MATEEAKFTELVQEHPFAVREYAAHVEAQTRVETDFSNAGKQAFGRLFKYITGHNVGTKKIAMTSPVRQAPSNQGPQTPSKRGENIAMTSPVGQRQVNGQWQVSFIMPAGSRIEDLPHPEDANVHLSAVPTQRMAVIRYSGSWSEARFQVHKQRLEHWIQAKGYQATGEASWARYNPPFTPWFLRRNEVLIPLLMPQATG